MIKQDELLCLTRHKLNVSGGKISKKKHKTWPFRKQGAKENFKQTNFGKSDKRLQEMKVNGKSRRFRNKYHVQSDLFFALFKIAQTKSVLKNTIPA